ncbi:HAD hydrolase family protein [[Ruminococcus] lactaris]|uniref:HAD hydrolase family protein n=1 Tax=[Ruminococcus] lactaris TaxID=46228 RepID=UPI003D74A381
MQIPHACNNGTSFVLASARCPAAIEPIISNYGLTCSIIAFSGGLILDENRSVLYEKASQQRTRLIPDLTGL